jgi:hypothetical protein
VDEKIAEWQALADGATKGPWWPRYGGEPGYIFSSATGRVVADVPSEKSDAIVPDDSRFIAASREAVPALLALVTRLRAELAAERERAAGVADAVYDENEESMYGAGWAAASAKIAAAIRRG